MSKCSVPYRVSVEGLDLTDTTKNKLVLPLNEFNEQVNSAVFQKGISINDNSTSQIMTQTFTSGQTLVVKNPLPTVPVGVVVISGNGPSNYVENIWLTPQSDQTQIGVTVNWQPNSYSGPCTFILVGG